jgi:hypothetical protein
MMKSDCPEVIHPFQYICVKAKRIKREGSGGGGGGGSLNIQKRTKLRRRQEGIL